MHTVYVLFCNKRLTWLLRCCVQYVYSRLFCAHLSAEFICTFDCELIYAASHCTSIRSTNSVAPRSLHIHTSLTLRFEIRYIPAVFMWTLTCFGFNERSRSLPLVYQNARSRVMTSDTLFSLIGAKNATAFRILCHRPSPTHFACNETSRRQKASISRPPSPFNCSLHSRATKRNNNHFILHSAENTLYSSFADPHANT